MDNCRLAHNVTISDSKYLDPLEDPRRYLSTVSLPIVIHKNTLVYAGAIILLNVTIPENSTVAAYSVVTSGINLTQPGTIFGSTPTCTFKPYRSV